MSMYVDSYQKKIWGWFVMISLCCTEMVRESWSGGPQRIQTFAHPRKQWQTARICEWAPSVHGPVGMHSKSEAPPQTPPAFQLGGMFPQTWHPTPLRFHLCMCPSKGALSTRHLLPMLKCSSWCEKQRRGQAVPEIRLRSYPWRPAWLARVWSIQAKALNALLDTLRAC